MGFEKNKFHQKILFFRDRNLFFKILILKNFRKYFSENRDFPKIFIENEYKNFGKIMEKI